MNIVFESHICIYDSIIHGNHFWVVGLTPNSHSPSMVTIFVATWTPQGVFLPDDARHPNCHAQRGLQCAGESQPGSVGLLGLEHDLVRENTVKQQKKGVKPTQIVKNRCSISLGVNL